MNKVILMGRLTRDPEIKYSQSSEPLAIARYTLAVNRRYKRDGDPDADFVNIISFGRAAEFAEKYYKKGQLVSIVGRLQVRSYDDNDGKKRWITEVIAEEQHFAESKSAFEQRQGAESNIPKETKDGFVPVDDSDEDDDLPF